MSDGETARADNNRIYVVRASGSVVPNEGARWFPCVESPDPAGRYLKTASRAPRTNRRTRTTSVSGARLL